MLVDELSDQFVTTSDVTIAWRALEIAESVSMRNLSRVIGEGRDAALATLRAEERQILRMIEQVLQREIFMAGEESDPAELAAIASGIEELLRDRTARIERLAADHPAVAVIWRPSGLAAEQMRAFASEGPAERYRFFVSDDYYYGWHVGSGEPCFARLGSRSDIDAAVDRLRLAIDAAELDDALLGATRDLYQSLLAPLGLPSCSEYRSGVRASGTPVRSSVGGHGNR